jgi:hypothetical protein
MGAMESSNQRNSLFFSPLYIDVRPKSFFSFPDCRKATLAAAAGNISEIFLPIN